MFLSRPGLPEACVVGRGALVCGWDWLWFALWGRHRLVRVARGGTSPGLRSKRSGFATGRGV